MTSPSEMPSASAMLDSIKQQVHYYKRAFDIRLFEARHLTAKTAGFDGWFELNRIAKTNPTDLRLLACSLSNRNMQSMATPEIVAEVQKQVARFIELTTDMLPLDRAMETFSKARGSQIEADQIIKAAKQIIAERPVLPAAPSDTSRPAFPWQLFDQSARLTFVSGYPGSGKSVLAYQIAQRLADSKKPVCFIDPIGVSSSAHDLGSRMRDRILHEHAGRAYPAQQASLPDRLERISVISAEHHTLTPDRFSLVISMLTQVEKRLHPESMVVLDEFFFTSLNQNGLAEQYLQVMQAVIALLQKGHSVMLVSQDRFDSSYYGAHMTKQQFDQAIVVAGQMQKWYGRSSAQHMLSDEEKLYDRAGTLGRFEFLIAEGATLNQPIKTIAPTINLEIATEPAA